MGSELTTDTIDSFMKEYGSDITCIAFMGGDAEPKTIDMLSAYIHRTYPAIKTAWYSGRTQLSPHIDKSNLDYYKLGPYLRHLGPLNSPTTNQRLYRKTEGAAWEDITRRLQKAQ